MRASSNNYSKKVLPFTDTTIHSNKFSEDETGYDSLPKQARINSTAGLSSSSSSSNDQYDRIMNLVKSMASSTDISTAHDGIDTVVNVAQRIAQYSKQTQSNLTVPIRKMNRTRVQPIPDSTSDSADSFALLNHTVLVSSYRQKIPTVSSIDIPPFGGNLEYIRDNRFDSTTTVDHVKNDVVAIELLEKQQQTNPIVDSANEQPSSRIKRLGELIRSLPANILAIVFISLIGGLFVSVILIIIVIA
ncbi:unnamed protein product [Adineta ricciae]|uniref:Uncharacterized protein n=1 Tax=Adineta ricciae TaxID=249248 RepID=A0A814X6N5_ADIRI|nr:unnamed protein product [Adineta ricciae]